MKANVERRMKGVFLAIVLVLLLLLVLTGCASTPGPRPSTLDCDGAKQIADWDPWTAEVRRILCAEINACGENLDEGLGDVGYGFAVTLYHKAFTPCRAAEAIIARRQEVAHSDTPQKFDADGHPNFGPRK